MCQIGGTYDSVTLSVGTDRSLAQLDVGLYDCVERTLSVDVTTIELVGTGYWQLVVYQPAQSTVHFSKGRHFRGITLHSQPY